MSFQLTAEQSDQMSASLGRLDRVAHEIQQNHAKWGMPFEQARAIVNALDTSMDDIELMTFGEASVRERRAEIVREAMVKEGAVIQRDADEGYMDTFQNIHQPVQTDADEPYMAAYNDDQSSGVIGEKDTAGRPLTPGQGTVNPLANT